MKILRLTIVNFQGIEELEIDAGGDCLDIYGDNETGKTTIASAFSWLLFGKNSLGQTDFSLKPLENGKPRHNLVTKVEGVFDIGDTTVVLRKEWYEKWTQRRKTGDLELTRHTTDHYINDVPVRMSDYDRQMNQIADPEMFRLLTDPLYFAERLDWKDRRRILLEVCGNVTVDDCIAANHKLEPLTKLLGDRTPDDMAAVLKAKLKKVNDELDKIPIRIDEARRAAKTPDTDIKDLKAELAQIDSRIDEESSRQIRIEEGGEAAALKAEIATLRADMTKRETELRSEAQESARADREKLDTELEVLGRRSLELNAAWREKIQNADQKKRDAEDCERRLVRVRADYDRRRAENFPELDAQTCEVCGQDLPQDDIESRREEFNLQKSHDLKALKAQGITLTDEKTAALNVEEDWRTQADAIWAELEPLNSKIQHLRAERAALVLPEPDMEEDPCWADIDAQIREKEEQAAQTNFNNRAGIEDCQEKIRVLRLQRTDVRSMMQEHEAAQRADERVKELEKQQRKIGKEKGGLLEQQDLLDLLVKTQVDLLDSKVNQHFDLVRFKLYHIQVDGGLQQCCEVTVDGIPYSTGLNTGNRINAGLDIIRTLGRHYGMTMPVFADNAEAVTRPLKIDAQLVRLIVSGADTKLRIETV